MAGRIATLFNGPLLAGVGATVDAGLLKSRYHVLPWNPADKTTLRIVEARGKVHLEGGGKRKKIKLEDALVYRYAKYNVDVIYGIQRSIDDNPNMETDEAANLRMDMITLVYLMLAYGYYGGECRESTADEKKTIAAISAEESEVDEVITLERLNRAGTFILARMHTKYQTNHAIGGMPVSASIASAIKAFYGLTAGALKQEAAKKRMKTITDVLYWAVHPANETLLIPSVIANSHIKETRVHTNGPVVRLMDTEEYFNIRSRTPPASTHLFYVCAAAAKALEPLGVLPYMPDPSRVEEVITGLSLIERVGAALHPAARYWGLERQTANQKIVETLAADLGYAVRKLLGVTTLAASPLLMKEDGLDAGWRAFVDALRAAMEDRGKELLEEGVIKAIKDKIAPKAVEVQGMKRIKGYLTTGSVGSEDSDGPMMSGAAGPGGDEEEDEDGGESDGDDEGEEHGEEDAGGADEGGQAGSSHEGGN
jgi:hypothetical protein